MVAKKWEERLPLSDLRGLQLFGAALYHAAKFHESRVRGAFDRFERERLQDLCPFHKEQIQEFESCSELLQFHLMPLGVSKEISAAAKNLRIQDIRFTAPELHRHQRLIFFVRDAKSEFTAHFDRDTPISHNTDLEGAL